MALTPKSSTKHNVMLGQRIKHPPSTNFIQENADDESEGPRVKRVRIGNSDRSSPEPAGVEAVSESEDDPEQKPPRPTDLESALPSIKVDQDAIDEYESSQTAQRAETSATDISDRFSSRQWVKGKSSIYVDAFNLALETVLEEESHLFDEAEKALFENWRSLSYDAQFL
jgi:Fanconi-associated nuclease 1